MNHFSSKPRGLRSATLLAFLGVAAMASAVPLAAQGGATSVYGTRWAIGSTVFVSSSSGTDSTAPGAGTTRASAYRTLQFALDQTIIVQGSNPAPIVINVLPGLYQPTGFSMPANGVRLQALGDGVVVSGTLAPTGAVITVDSVGVETLPDGSRNPASIIQGFEIRDGSIGVNLDLGLARPGNELQTEIRDCRITANLSPDGLGGTGIRIETSPDTKSAFVIEDNEIFANGVKNPNKASFGIDMIIDGIDSTLIRSNSVSFQEVAMRFRGRDPDAWCRPRVFSNFIHDHEQMIDSNDAGPIFVHNTVYRIIDWSGAPQRYALLHNAPPLSPTADVENERFGFVVLNCIVDHHPLDDSLRGFGTFAVAFSDLENTGNPSSNVDARLGARVAFNRTVAYVDPALPDLHLLPTAAQVDDGSSALVLPGRTATLLGVQIPIDVRQDVDGDVRLTDRDLDGIDEPDRGADEVHNTRLSILDGAEAVGNVKSGGSAVLRMEAPAGSNVLLYAWIDDPAQVFDDVIFNNFLLVPPSDPFSLGNVLLPNLPPFPVAVGAAPQGVFDWSFTAGPAYPAESEVLLQAFSLRPFPNLRADASNRLRIEIND